MNQTENVVITTLDIYGELVPINIEVRGTYTTFKAQRGGEVVEAETLAALETKLRVQRRTKRVPWNLAVKIPSGTKLEPALITGKHATTRKLLVRSDRNRWGEKVAPRSVQMDHYQTFFKPETPDEEYTALRVAVREAEAKMAAFNKLWRVNASELIAPAVKATEAAVDANEPLPAGGDEPEPLSVEASNAALKDAENDEGDEAGDL